MKLYKIIIKPVTSFCSPLQSDTFFGAFCWSYLYRYGEEALKILLCRFRAGNPDIIFSNAFLSGNLPIPFGMNDLGEERTQLLGKQERYEKYIDDKKKENISWIPLDDFNKIINGRNISIFNSQEIEKKTTLWRTAVKRGGLYSEDEERKGNLFQVEEIYSDKAYDVYIYSTLEKSVLNCVLEDMFRFGIGAKRSIGKGAFEMVGDLEEFDGFETPERANGFIALSNFVPKKQDPTKGYYKTFVKYPKVSNIVEEGDSPFKKPLVFLKAGSVFYDAPVRKFYGSCVERIALKGGRVSEEIVIGAYTIAVPCYINA